jgi:hypothetical protein
LLPVRYRNERRFGGPSLAPLSGAFRFVLPTFAIDKGCRECNVRKIAFEFEFLI